jgi:hypothetical protein
VPAAQRLQAERRGVVIGMKKDSKTWCNSRKKIVWLFLLIVVVLMCFPVANAQGAQVQVVHAQSMHAQLVQKKISIKEERRKQDTKKSQSVAAVETGNNIRSDAGIELAETKIRKLSVWEYPVFSSKYFLYLLFFHNFLVVCIACELFVLYRCHEDEPDEKKKKKIKKSSN